MAELLKVVERNKAGDEAALEILLQSDWYRGFLTDLREGYGGSAHKLSEQQGATSPNTPVEDNMKNAVDLIRRVTRGDFDDFLPEWRQWDSDRKAAQEDLAGFVTLKKSGSLSEADIEDMKKNCVADMEGRVEDARVEAAREVYEGIAGPPRKKGKGQEKDAPQPAETFESLKNKAGQAAADKAEKAARAKDNTLPADEIKKLRTEAANQTAREIDTAAKAAGEAATKTKAYNDLVKYLVRLNNPKEAEKIRKGTKGVPTNKSIEMLSGYRTRRKAVSDLGKIADKLLPRKENGKKYGFNEGLQATL